MRAVVETPDLPVLEALRPLISQVGAVIEDSADSTNYDLLILSHASSRRRVAAVLQERKHILGVIASRFRVPRELEALGSVQLVDFSRHDSMGVIAALRLLTARDDSERSHLQPYLEPVNLAQVALPNIPTALADCLLSLVLLTLIMLGLLIMQGTSLENPLPAEAALAVTVLLLLAVNEPVRRGRRPMPRWGLLILAFLPLILISLSALQLPFDVNIAGLALYPVGWLYLLGTVTLTVARCVILLLHHPQALGSADSFGMPPLPLPLRATFAWLGACILLLSLVIGPNIQLLNS